MSSSRYKTKMMSSMSCDYPDCTNRISRRCTHCGGSYCVRHVTLAAYGENICDLCAQQRAQQRAEFGWRLIWLLVFFGVVFFLCVIASQIH